MFCTFSVSIQPQLISYSKYHAKPTLFSRPTHPLSSMNVLHLATIGHTPVSTKQKEREKTEKKHSSKCSTVPQPPPAPCQSLPFALRSLASSTYGVVIALPSLAAASSAASSLHMLLISSTHGSHSIFCLLTFPQAGHLLRAVMSCKAFPANCRIRFLEWLCFFLGTARRIDSQIPGKGFGMLRWIVVGRIGRNDPIE